MASLRKTINFKDELVAVIIITTTAMLLVFFQEKDTLSQFIFGIGLMFCLYEVLSRKNLESAIQVHWLLLAVIAGVAYYNLRSFATLFLAAAFSIRFAVSLIRRDETKEISSEISKVQTEYMEELNRVQNSLATEMQMQVGHLKASNVYTVKEYKQKLVELRANLENNYQRKLMELDSVFQTKCGKLESALSQNKVAFAEELARLENSVKLAEKELSRMKNEELAVLNDRLANQDELIRKLEANRNQNQIFTNGELHNLLLDTLRNAEFEVDIMSPWVNFRIVDSEMQKNMERLLRRNVVIKLAYGIENNNYPNAESRNTKVQDTVERLQKRFGKYKNFHVKKISSHGKIFICDDKYYVLTSMNPLSNDGSSWEEIGEQSSNKENVFRYREEYFDF